MKEIPFQAFGENVLCEAVPVKQTAGGVILPDNMSGMGDAPTFRVVAVGELVPPEQIKPGDLIYGVTKVHPLLVVVEDKEYICISAQYIIGKVPA